MDPIYSTDAYPRDGCRLAVDVTAEGYVLAVFEPGGRRIEGYAPARTARQLARMVEEWLCGYPPKLHQRLDQPSARTE